MTAKSELALDGPPCNMHACLAEQTQRGECRKVYLGRLSKHAVQVAPKQKRQNAKSYGSLRYVDHVFAQKVDAAG